MHLNRNLTSTEKLIDNATKQNDHLSKFQLYCLYTKPSTTMNLIPYNNRKSNSKSLKQILNYNKSSNKIPMKDNSTFKKNLIIIKNINKKIDNQYESPEKVVRFFSNTGSSDFELMHLNREMFIKEDQFLKYNKWKNIITKVSEKVGLKQEQNEILVLLEEIIDEIIRFSEWFVSEKYQEHFFSKLIKVVQIILNDKASEIMKKYENQIKDKLKKRLENETGNQWEKILYHCDAKIQAEIFDKYWDKENNDFESQLNKIEELRKEARGVKSFRKSNTVIQNRNEIVKLNN